MIFRRGPDYGTTAPHPGFKRAKLEAMGKRTEKDSMGTIKIPSGHYWGAQTEHPMHNLSVGHDTLV